MAAALLIKPVSLRPPTPSETLNPRPSSSSSSSLIRCGPRDNRGPLQRGRTLSTEAILAVQALKRARGDDSKIDAVVSRTLVRLLKPDLLAALAELQRQDQWRLALKVFVAVRKEFWYRTDYTVYADMVSALARNGGMASEIDVLVGDLLEEERKGILGDDVRGLSRLLKALIAAGRGEAVRDIYRAMKRGGCAGDELLFRVLRKGLRRLGEVEAADEVERDWAVWFERGGRVEPLSV